MTFMPPLDLMEPEERAVRQAAQSGARGSGTPFISFYAPPDSGAGPRLGLHRRDGGVAAAARKALADVGLHPEVVTGDGFDGHSVAAPYDRIISTAGVRTFPHAWVEQTKPTGVIIAPWGTRFGNQDAVARLVVSADGKAASGFFTRPVEFMKLRAQRLSWSGHTAYVPAEGTASAGVRRSVSEVTEGEFLPGTWDALGFALGLRIPDCLRIVADKRDGIRPVWLYGLSDTSWAVAVFRDGSETDVHQSGGRELWTEAESAHRWWKRSDSSPS